MRCHARVIVYCWCHSVIEDEEAGPEHAKLSPSSAEGWWTCPDYVQANEGLPDEESEFAAEGTVAHSISDMCLASGLDAYDFVGTLTRYKHWTFEWTEDDAENLQPGLDAARATPGKFYGEHRVNLEALLGEGQFGTLDRGFVWGDGFKIEDLKWGRYIPVSPIRNKQTMLYAWGFWNSIARPIVGDSPDVEIHIEIDQPRCAGGGGLWKTTLGDLLEFAEEARAKAIAALDSNNRTRVASPHGCLWCKARVNGNGCYAYDAYELELLGTKFDDIDEAIEYELPLILPQEMTVERRSFILMHKRQIEAWLEGLHAAHMREYLAGYGGGLLKAVLGRKSPDAWEDKINAQMVAISHLSSKAFTQKLATPTQVKKAVGPEIFESDFAEFVRFGEKKPVLVPVEDDRAGIVSHDLKFDEQVENSDD